MKHTLIRAALTLALFAAIPAAADTVNHGAVTTDPATGTAQATTNTKLDTLHNDLGTTLHGDIATTLGAKLDTLHADHAVATPAGSNIIGKTGSDNTTPGTTDSVTPRFTRTVRLTGTFTPGQGTGYGGAVLMGASGTNGAMFCPSALDHAGNPLPAGSLVQLLRFEMSVPVTTLSAAGNLAVIFFSATPSTAANDNAWPSWTDAEKRSMQAPNAFATPTAALGSALLYNAAAAGYVTVTSSQTICFVLWTAQTITWATVGQAKWELYYGD